MHLRRLGWLALFFLLLTAAMLACGREVVEGRTEAGDASLQGVDSPDATGLSACEACQAATCRNESAACGANPSCAPFLACQAACPTDAMGQAVASCVASCFAGDAGTSELVTDLLRCEASAVCASCMPPFDAGYVDAESCDLVVLDGDNVPCDYCLSSRCCPQHLGCADGGCLEGRQCLLDCEADGGTTCYTDCYGQSPGSTGRVVQGLKCLVDRCTLECAVADNPCIDCRVHYCPRQVADLASTVQNSMLYFCISQCQISSTNCYQGCEQQFPEGVEAFNAWNACAAQFCASGCTGQ